MKNPLIKKFCQYLTETRKLSSNTLEAYRIDCEKFASFLGSNGRDILSAGKSDAVSFIIEMQTKGKSDATVSRCVSSLKSLYSYLSDNKLVKSNPMVNLKLPKAEKKEIPYLTTDEIDSLLSAIGSDTALDIRDKAMLEVLYGTGIKASELLSLHVKDADTDLGYIRVWCTSNVRIVPIGKSAVKSLNCYLTNSRPMLTNGESDILFLNSSGLPMSRQGFWKIIKGYAKKAGIEKDISPASIRHSFALHLIENGADIASVSEMLGHKDITTTMKYAKQVKSGIREIYNKTHPRA